MNISLLLEMAAEAFGDRIALGSADSAMSYDVLRSSVRRAVRFFAQFPFDNVVFIGLNSQALPLCLFAAAYSNRSFVPLNYRLTDIELAKLVQRAGPSIVIVDDDMIDRVSGAGIKHTILRSNFELLCKFGIEQTSSAAETEQDKAVKLFTSGTTGEPKAAVLRHRHLFSYVTSTVELGCADPDEAALVSVPPYHVAGISALLTGVYAGRRIVQLPSFSADAWIDGVLSGSITHAMVVPTMLQRILDVVETRRLDLRSLKHLSYGGGRMPLALIERAMRALPGVAFVNAYGLTETSSTISVLGPQDHWDAASSNDPKIRRRLGSVGKPLPNIEIEVRDGNGALCSTECSGEIWVRGEQISGEYEGRTRIRPDGWFPTNDEGWMDEAGYLYVAGRLDDIIVRGGENISPGEIEDVLRSNASVTDVAVVGLPDEEWGERIAAVVVTNSEISEDALKAWVRERLRSSKTPEAIYFQHSLPYNETGKLLRRTLQAEIATRAQTVAKRIVV